MKIFLKRLFFKILRKKPTDMPMIGYWRTKTKVGALLTKAKDGSTIMRIEGEEHPFQGFPRGYLLDGRLSKLKHEIKNQVFNDSWAKLEQGVSPIDVSHEIKDDVLPRIFELFQQSKYDMVPQIRMAPAVKEIHRAWTKVTSSKKSLLLRDVLCHIVQEDDAYRFRLQWIVTYFNPNSWYMKLFGDPVQQFEKALTMMEHAEVIGDMKERVRLLRRIVLALLQDKTWRENFLKICREIDWNKVKLTEADKFHFRGKWFKVDMDLFEY